MKRKIEFNISNLKECQCPKCPVEIRSSCAENLLEKSEIKLLQRSLPNQNETPELYCSSGKSACLFDLDLKKTCICPTCPVWSKNSLSSTYYCSLGNSEENG